MGLAIILYTTSYRLMIAALLLEGMMATVRLQVSGIYLYENLCHANYAKIIGIDSCCQGVFGICGALYFIYISNDANGVLYFAFGLQLLGTIGALMFYQESPKYLIVTNQYERAQTVFS